VGARDGRTQSVRACLFFFPFTPNPFPKKPKIDGQPHFCRNYAKKGQPAGEKKKKKKKNPVRVGRSLEISGSIDDGSLGAKKKKKHVHL
jgi:hypothetical protein